MKYIKQNQAEYLQSTKAAMEKIMSRTKKNPADYCEEILELTINRIELGGESDASDVNEIISDRIRKFHDCFGWRAANTPLMLGKCAGAFLRTKSFLDIEPRLVDGSKTALRSPNGVSIEHAIPIKIIRDLVAKNIDRQSTAKDVFELLIGHSICVAFTRFEVAQNIKPGFTSQHPDYQSKTLCKETIRPLIRYSEDTQIVSMITGKAVPLDSSLASLLEEVQALELYTWAFNTAHRKY